MRRGAQHLSDLGSGVGDVEPQSSPAHWDAGDAGVAAPWSVRSEFLNQPRCAERPVPLGVSWAALLPQTFGHGCDEGGRLRGVPERCLIDVARDSVQLRAR